VVYRIYLCYLLQISVHWSVWRDDISKNVSLITLLLPLVTFFLLQKKNLLLYGSGCHISKSVSAYYALLFIHELCLNNNIIRKKHPAHSHFSSKLQGHIGPFTALLPTYMIHLGYVIIVICSSRCSRLVVPLVVRYNTRTMI